MRLGLGPVRPRLRVLNPIDRFATTRMELPRPFGSRRVWCCRTNTSPHQLRHSRSTRVGLPAVRRPQYVGAEYLGNDSIGVGGDCFAVFESVVASSQLAPQFETGHFIAQKKPFTNRAKTGTRSMHRNEICRVRFGRSHLLGNLTNCRPMSRIDSPSRADSTKWFASNHQQPLAPDDKSRSKRRAHGTVYKSSVIRAGLTLRRSQQATTRSS